MLLGSRKVNEAVCDIGVQQHHAHAISHIQAFESLDHLPSVVGEEMRTQVPLSDAPVTMASNFAPMRDASKEAAADLFTARSTFAALCSCRVQCAAQVLKFCVSVRRGALCQCRLEQSLRDEIGETPIGRGGMRVIEDGETEMPRNGLSGFVQDVFAQNLGA